VLAPALLLLIQKAVSISGSPHEDFALGAAQLAEGSGVASAGLVPLHAAYDVLQQLPQLLERRREVQSHRRRPDEEIFRQFVRPFKPWTDDEPYLQASVLLRELFGLDELFVGAPEDAEQLLRVRRERGSQASASEQRKPTTWRRLVRRLSLLP
jgi:hypothetical protein